MTTWWDSPDCGSTITLRTLPGLMMATAARAKLAEIVLL